MSDISTIIIISILIFGALHGLVNGIILIGTKGTNKTANRILALILFLLSYRLFVQILRLFGLGYYDGWYYIMIDMTWVHGALLYFYTRAQVAPDFKFGKKDWIHFIPLALQVSFSIFVRLQNLYWDGTRDSLSWLGYWGYVVWMNNSTIYIVASALIIYYAYRSNQLIGKAKSEFDLGGEHLLWIKRIIQSYRVYFSLVLSVLLVDLVLYNVINDTSYFYFERFYYYPFFIGLAVLTYWIGLEGFSRRKNPGIVFKNVLGTEQRGRLAEIAVLIEAAMRSDKLYKDPQLSLNLLAEHIQTKSYLVSLCFSEVIKKRFNDYINEFRVEEVQALLKNPDSSKYTLLSLALEAGFNSKSSFNRAIGKHLGISPKQLKLNNPTENG